MRIAHGGVAVVIVCVAVTVHAEETPSDVPLGQTQRALGEARRLDKEGKYGEAVSLVERVVALQEKALGPNQLEVAESLNLLGELYRKLGDYKQAEPSLQRALHIREVALGEHHLDVAQSLHTLAKLYYTQGLYERAELLYRRALQIREASLGKSHPEVAASLNNLALLYKAQGAYARAEPLFQRALQIREASQGKSHPDIAAPLNNLANLYFDQGAYTQAEPLHLRALQIREATLGKTHPDVAQSLNSLANLYFTLGAYDQAEPLYLRALQIQETAFGKNHLDIALSLNNLANLYDLQGAPARAEPLYLRALQIRESILGKTHPDVAKSVNNLANLYFLQRAYAQAEPLYLRALQIGEATLGINHPDVAVWLHNLANVYTSRGDYAQAERLYLRVLQSQEATLGKNHPIIALSLHNLANLYLRQGSYDKVESLHLRAVQIEEAALGRHFYLAQLLTDLAALYLSRNQLASALPLLERSFTISDGRLRKEALILSEARLTNLLELLDEQDENLYNVLREHLSESIVRRLALKAALLHKGRSAGEMADTSRIIYRHLKQADQEEFLHLRALRTQLSSLSLGGLDRLSAADYQTRLKELETQGDALEAELARRSALLRAQEQLPGPDDVIERVAATLPPDGALIEIVAFSARPLVPLPGTPPSKVPSTPVYFALVLLPSGDVRVADLGPAAAIDDAVWRLRLALSSSQAENYLPAVQRLYRLAFQPLQPLLGAQRRLFIAPDGQLNLVPFAVLHDGNRFLADTFDITYLTSGKDLVRKTGESPAARSVVVLADPDFDATRSTLVDRRGGASAPSAPPVSTSLERSAAVERFFTQQRWGLIDQPLEPLPGTRQEAQAIHKLFPHAQLLLGPAATKKALLGVAAPGILHIATHGFFLGDVVGPPRTRGQDSVGVSAGPPTASLPADPLLRAGLVLAGAQAARATDSDAGKRHAEDTVATALELAGIDLWGTEMVVLSACSTGQGEVKRGQGVYGLRRAFTVAGAESLVTSLWKVSDEKTHEFMRDFYRQLKAGRGRAEALREAMQRIRKRHAHPYYWAPFILVGNGAPLRSFAPLRPSGLR